MADSPASGRPLDERLRDIGLIKQALALAVRDALVRHKQAGNPIAVWRDGRLLWIAPEDIPVATGD
jgi:hypothetical protein